MTRNIVHGGNVLVPVHTTGRVIELTAQLDNVWEREELLRDSEIPSNILHALSARNFHFARIMIEWANDEFTTPYNFLRKNMYPFRHVQLVQDVLELNVAFNTSVLLESPVLLEKGSPHPLTKHWAHDTYVKL